MAAGPTRGIIVMHSVQRAIVTATAAITLAVGIAAGGAGVALAAPAAASEADTAVPTPPSLADQDASTDHVLGATTPQVRSATPSVSAPASGVPGFDVSSAQGRTPDFAGASASGARFVFIKSSEGTPGRAASGNATGSVADYRVDQVRGAKNAGLLVGTYHYALPYYSSGATQARFYLDNARTSDGTSLAWADDGTSLPPTVDLESPSEENAPKEGGRCWGLSEADMVSWIQSYVATVVAATGVQPIIYTNNDFWETCTGNSRAFPKDRLFIAWYPDTTTNTPLLPSAFPDWSFWQWSQSASPFPGDQDVFHGTAAQLTALTKPSAPAVSRLAGGNAYATAANIAASAYSPRVTAATGDAPTRGSIPVAYVATRSAYPDALSGAAAAGHLHAPVLLTDPGTLPGATAAELAQLRPQRIVVIGGTNAVGDGVLTQLAQYATTGDVTRLSGVNRYDTSAAISAASFAPYSASAYEQGLTAYVATGTNFPDALAGAAVAAARATGPMLLVTPDQVPASIARELARLHPTRVVILGGTAAVDDTVRQQLATAVGGDAAKVERWAGVNRFDTSVVIAQNAFGGGTATAFLATGTNFPDALAGAPTAGFFAAPVLLTRPDTVPDHVRGELARLGASGIVVLGGPVAVSAAVEASL